MSMIAVSTNCYWDKCRRVSRKEPENEVLRLTENLRRRKLIASETLSAFEQEYIRVDFHKIDFLQENLGNAFLRFCFIYTSYKSSLII